VLDVRERDDRAAYDTGNIEPSRRKNQSRSLVTVSPVARGRSMGQSAAG
jgi:hypothetical protein